MPKNNNNNVAFDFRRHDQRVVKPEPRRLTLDDRIDLLTEFVMLVGQTNTRSDVPA